VPLGGGANCTQSLFDKSSLRVYGDELRRLAAGVVEALHQRGALEIARRPAIHALIREEEEGLRKEAEALFCEVAGDVAAQLVYDLHPKAAVLSGLMQRAKRLCSQQSTLGLESADLSVLELTSDLLSSVNCTDPTPVGSGLVASRSGAGA